MTQYVIMGEFDNILKQKIVDLKEKVLSMFGSYQYLHDPPHCTFYLGSFHSFQVWSDKLECRLQDISENLYDLSIIGWETFFLDKVTGNNTLYCKFDSGTIDHLRSIQMEIVEIMRPYLDRRIIERYKHCSDTFSNNERDNLEQFGFPYVGSTWIPHITIASFSPDKYSEIYSNIQNECPIGQWKLSRITINILSEKDMLSVLKTIEVA